MSVCLYSVIDSIAALHPVRREFESPLRLSSLHMSPFLQCSCHLPVIPILILFLPLFMKPSFTLSILLFSPPSQPNCSPFLHFSFHPLVNPVFHRFYDCFYQPEITQLSHNLLIQITIYELLQSPYCDYKISG